VESVYGGNQGALRDADFFAGACRAAPRRVQSFADWDARGVNQGSEAEDLAQQVRDGADRRLRRGYTSTDMF
jgi:hypothetical protein